MTKGQQQAWRGAGVALLAALVLTGSDQLEALLLGRTPVYAPEAIARRLFGRRPPTARAAMSELARREGVRGLALRAVYSSSLGALFASFRHRLPRHSLPAGLSFAALICGFELLTLPVIGAVPPLRAWSRAELALLIAHAAVFGATTAALNDGVVPVLPARQAA